MDREDLELEQLFQSRKPREKSLVVSHKGNTVFVREADVQDWQAMRRTEAIRHGLTVGAAVTVMVAIFCLIARVGSPAACYFTASGVTLGYVCLELRLIAENKRRSRAVY